MIGEKIDERRLFSYEERQAILKDNYGICTCCGKKLTTKTLRVEHIIPLSRGGKNEPENLTALCEDCNKWKDNKIYIPGGFYRAIQDTPRYWQMTRYMAEWFKTIRDSFDLERFPMISFNTLVQYDPVGNRRVKSQGYNRQLLYQWSYVGQDEQKEVENWQGEPLQEMREALRGLFPEKDRKRPISFYRLKKVSTGKLMALIAVAYRKDDYLVFYVLRNEAPKKWIPILVCNFIHNILFALDNIAGQYVPHYTVFSPQKESGNLVNTLMGMDDHIASGMGYDEIKDKAGNTMLYCTQAIRKSKTQNPNPESAGGLQN